MKSFTLFALAAWTASTASGFAFDAPPPLKVTTLKQTFEAALTSVIPIVSFTDNTAKQGLAWLDDSENTLAGRSLSINTTAVQDRLDRQLISTEQKDVPWLTMLGVVADRLDADIVVEPGVFRLVPRTPPKTGEKK